jgi:hypothetical protein
MKTRVKILRSFFAKFGEGIASHGRRFEEASAAGAAAVAGNKNPL